MSGTFAKYLGHLLNVLDICKTTWTFTKLPGYLLNVLVDSGLDWTGLDWTGLWTVDWSEWYLLHWVTGIQTQTLSSIHMAEETWLCTLSSQTPLGTRLVG